MSAEGKDKAEQLSRESGPAVRRIESSVLPRERSVSGEEKLAIVSSHAKFENYSPIGNGVTAEYRYTIDDNTSTRTETEESSPPLSLEADDEVTKASSPDIKRVPSSIKLDKDGDSCVSSAGDICRICHMGGFPALSGSRPVWEWPNRGVRRVDSQTSTVSSYAYLGPLISACKCRGTVGLVHTECLERWLTESGHTRCELCGHRYPTKRVPRHGIFRSVIIWFNTVIATRQMLLDILYLVVTTPLALFSCYVCALALKMIVESGFQDIPWMIVAMLPTCSLTLVAYWGWLITLGRYISRLHGRRWRRFWRNNFVVRLIPEASTLSIGTVNDSAQERTEYRAARRLDYEDDFFFDRFPEDDEDEDLFRIVDNILQP